MTIGQLAREAGVRASAVRYYESLGLLPAPARRSGRRDYTDGAVAQLAVVQFALATGFTLRETRQLVRELGDGTTAGDRWRALAAIKLREMDAIIVHAEAMKALLTKVRQCQCQTLVECGRALARTRQKWAATPATVPEPQSLRLFGSGRLLIRRATSARRRGANPRR